MSHVQNITLRCQVSVGDYTLSAIQDEDALWVEDTKRAQGRPILPREIAELFDGFFKEANRLESKGKR